MSAGNGKVALVTGASAGIGKASALALIAAGWSVVLTARRAGELEAAVKASAAPDRGLAVPSDVGDPESVKALFARAKQKFGRLDLLFNNAGMGAPAMPMEELPFGATLRVIVDHEPATRNIPRSAREWGQEVLGVTQLADRRWAIDLVRRVR